MRRFALLGITVLSLTALTLLGCGHRPAPPAPEKVPNENAIGITLARSDGAWSAQLKADIEAAAAKHPEVRLVITDAPDAKTQQEQLDQFHMGHAQVMIVAPKDPQALADQVAHLVESGTSVIVLDRALGGDKYTCLIAPDATQIGAAAGKWLAERLKGKGNLVELRGPVDSVWAEDLHKVWRAALREPGYRFLFDDHVEPPKVDAGKLMSEALGRFQKIDAVFAYDDAAALAAYQAAKAAGREKGMLFLGVGGLPKEGAEYVSQGKLTVSFLHPTGGAEAIDAAMKLLHKEKLDKKIVPPTRPIVKETAH
jgi:ribose transport system substrate-binding protein